MSHQIMENLDFVMKACVVFEEYARLRMKIMIQFLSNYDNSPITLSMVAAMLLGFVLGGWIQSAFRRCCNWIASLVMMIAIVLACIVSSGGEDATWACMKKIFLAFCDEQQKILLSMSLTTAVLLYVMALREPAFRTYTALLAIDTTIALFVFGLPKLAQALEVIGSWFPLGFILLSPFLKYIHTVFLALSKLPCPLLPKPLVTFEITFLAFYLFFAKISTLLFGNKALPNGDAQLHE